MTERKTAAELMVELAQDATFSLEARRRSEAAERLERELAEAEVPLVSALRSVGVHVRSVWDLVEGQGAHVQAIPVLLEHAKYDYPSRVREGIMRAVAVPEAREYWGDLVDSFENGSLLLPPDLHYLTALAISAAANDDVIDDVIRLARDGANGPDRVLLLIALQRSNSPKARMCLRELRNDPVLRSEIKKMRRLGML